MLSAFSQVASIQSIHRIPAGQGAPGRRLPVALAFLALLVPCFRSALAMPREALLGHTLPVKQQEADHSDHPEGAGLPLHSLHRPGYLGVSLRDLDAAEATRLHLREAMGALIVTVDRDAPAWAAGLRPGDVVVEYGGQATAGVESLRRQLRESPAGQTITMRVRRADQEMSFAVMLGDQSEIAQNAVTLHLRPSAGTQSFAEGGVPPPSPGPSSAPTAAPALAPPPSAASHGVASTLFDALIPAATYTGLEVESLTPQLASFFGVHTAGGLLVTGVNNGSPAAASGLFAGDVIVRADNREIRTRSQLAHAFRKAKGDAVPLAVLRDHREITLRLQPGRRKRL